MEILEAKKIVKVYGSGETEFNALNGIDLRVNEGEFVAIVGASGSGKSTLLHILGGLDKPNSGEVIINNKNIYDLSEREKSIFRRREIGFIFQFYNLIPVLTVEENITLPMLIDERPIDKDYIEELLSILKLSDRRTHLPSALSGGQQQRVAIARALSMKPSIILADEPTGNLDSRMGTEVLDLLKLSIKKYHQTLIMITHSSEISKLADRVIEIADGFIVNDEVVTSL